MIIDHTPGYNFSFIYSALSLTLSPLYMIACSIIDLIFYIISFVNPLPNYSKPFDPQTQKS